MLWLGGEIPASVSDAHDQILLATIAVLATAVAGLVYVVKAYGQARAANKAVNNVGPGEHRLYDVIARIETKQDEFDRRWGSLPVEMNAVSLIETLHDVKTRLDRIETQLKEVP